MSNGFAVGPVTPFFIVADLGEALAHYCDGLGFTCIHQMEPDPPFFAMVRRGTAQIMLKDVGRPPTPNPAQHRDALWDAYIYVEDPKALASEFSARGANFKSPIKTRDDGLHGFEIADPDGYVCFFGRPV